MSEPKFAICADKNEFNIFIPLCHHTGVSLRNLVNILYSRDFLINKSLGTNFNVSKEFVEYLRDDSCIYTVFNFLKFTATYERSYGIGITDFEITEDNIIFKGFPNPENPDYIHGCIQLFDCINQQALTQRRTILRKANSLNEKYSMRIWLIRIGMKGDKYKTTCKILTNKLNGSSAYKTKKQEIIARKRYKMRKSQLS